MIKASQLASTRNTVMWPREDSCNILQWPEKFLWAIKHILKWSLTDSCTFCVLLPRTFSPFSLSKVLYFRILNITTMTENTLTWKKLQTEEKVMGSTGLRTLCYEGRGTIKYFWRWNQSLLLNFLLSAEASIAMSCSGFPSLIIEFKIQSTDFT